MKATSEMSETNGGVGVGELHKKDNSPKQRPIEDLREDLKRLASRLPEKIALIQSSRSLLEAESVRHINEREAVRDEIARAFKAMREKIDQQEKTILEKLESSCRDYEVINDVLAYIGSLQDIDCVESVHDSLNGSPSYEQIEKDVSVTQEIKKNYTAIEKILKAGPKKWSVPKKKYVRGEGSRGGGEEEEEEEEWNKLKGYSWCASTFEPIPAPRNFRRASESTFKWEMPESVKSLDMVALVVLDNKKNVVYSECASGATEELALEGLAPGHAYDLRLKVGYGLRWSELSNNVFVKPVLPGGEVVDFHWERPTCSPGAKRHYRLSAESSYRVENTSNYQCTVVTTRPFPAGTASSITLRICGMKRKGRSMFIGVSHEGIDLSAGDNYARAGWYMHCFDGALYSGPPHNYGFPGKKYLDPSWGRLKEGSVVTMRVDAEKGTISFEVDGVELGTAYEEIPLDRALYPTVIISSLGDLIEII